MKKLLFLCLLMFTLVIAPVAASALTLPADSFDSFATFNVSGDILTITLTDGRNATQGGQELTALFFNLSGFSGTLTPVSALIGASTVIGGSYPAGGNVGGEWEYLAGLDPNITFGATRGISSTGLGIFDTGNFNGPDLGGPPSGAVDGGQWGLTDGITVLSGNNSPLINNSVVFTLSGATGFVPSADNVRNVTYFYGTELGTTAVPEPSTLLLLGSGLIGLAGFVRRKVKK